MILSHMVQCEKGGEKMALYDMRVLQKRNLFALYKIKKNTPDKNPELEAAIIAAEAEMEQEDIAFVKQKIGEL